MSLNPVEVVSPFLQGLEVLREEIVDWKNKVQGSYRISSRRSKAVIRTESRVTLRSELARVQPSDSPFDPASNRPRSPQVANLVVSV